MPSSLGAQKPLTTWNHGKAHQYRAAHPGSSECYHFLLDMSPSMLEQATAVRQAYNRCLHWLQRHSSPMSLGQVICFDDRPRLLPLQPLGIMRPLTEQDYDPRQADGTAIFEAMGLALTTCDTPGTHILVLMTDGEDCCRRDLWTLTRCHEVFATLQQERGWVGVGFFVDAAAQSLGMALGFPPDNCMLLASDAIPAAFERFRQAMQRYLAAPLADRKRLAAHLMA